MKHEIAGGAKRRPLFSAEKQLQIMEQVVGKPSGTIVTLGGFEIDLVAIPFSKDRRIADLAQSLGALFDSAQKGGLKNFEEAAPLIVERYGDVKALIKEMIRDSVDVAADGEAVFDAWFDALPMIATVSTMLAATFKANGLSDMGNVLAAATSAARVPAAMPASPSPTPPATS